MTNTFYILTDIEKGVRITKITSNMLKYIKKHYNDLAIIDTYTGEIVFDMPIEKINTAIDLTIEY